VSDALTRHLVTFGRVLREAGLEVGPGRMQDALRGLDRVDITRQDDVYWTLRTTLVARERPKLPQLADGASGVERALAVTLQERG